MAVSITYDGATPTVGADADVWGTELNVGALAKIKVDLDALATLANAGESGLTATNLRVTAVETNYVHTGDIKFGLYSTAPAGWVKMNGGTVGNASSGATRANADTAALFALLWDLNATDSPILTSAGAGSTRGANAAADYAANKRLTVPDARGEFLRGLDDSRGVDTSRRLGSAQADELEAHTHSVSPPVASSEGGQGATTTGTLGGGESISSYDTASTGGTETRPRNVAALAVIKL
jgi:hypothetical protein